MDSSEWDARYQSADRLWSEGPNLFVADRLGPVAPGTGLDLAGGEGRNAIWLASRGWDMTVVDFSRVAIDRGTASGENVDFVVADVLEWEPSRSFDLVLIAYLHLIEEEFRAVIKRAETWLAPGGELFMIGHDRSNIDEGHGGPQFSEILWDVGEIAEMVSGQIVEAQVVRRPVEAEGEIAYALDTLVRVIRRDQD